MKALVTGATGFVGANLVQLLNERGWHVRVLRRSSSSVKALDGLQYESALGDIGEGASLGPACNGVDVVFHVAAAVDYWRLGKEKLYAINVGGTRNVLEAALASGVKRVVFTSSVAALGVPEWRKPADEGHPFNLQPSEFFYGHSKAEAEKVCGGFVARGLDVVTVNPGVVIGPRDVNLGSGSLFVEMHKRGIPAYPAGGVSVVDVADVAAAHVAAAEQGRAGERYILSGHNVWHRDLLAAIAKVVGREPPRIALPRAVGKLHGLVDFARDRLKLKLPINGEQLRFSSETMWFDNARARLELGLKPTPLEHTVERAWRWYRENGLIAA